MDNINPTGGSMDTAPTAGPELDITAKQHEAIAAQVAIYGTTDTPEVVGLIDYEVMATTDGLIGEDAPEGAVEAHFRYRYADEEDGDKGGLEVTVFAPDGSVLDSQDFG